MESEIKCLLDKAKSIKTISKKRLVAKLDIQTNPLTMIFINQYIKNNRVDLVPMVTRIFEFLQTKTIDGKLRFLFQMYDLDNDGYLTKKEFFVFLKELNKSILDDTSLQNIVDRTFADMVKYKTVMEFDDFKKLICSKNTNFANLILKIEKS